MKRPDRVQPGEQPYPTFTAYAAALEKALHSSSPTEMLDVASAALDGMPARVLRSTVDAHTRRVSGTFFSGRALAARLVKPYADLIRGGAIVADPACGAGDLLLAAAEHLRNQRQLSDTAASWNRQLVGFDINPAFVQVAKARLLLLLRHKQKDWTSALPHTATFDNIQARDSLSAQVEVTNAALLLLNPPFGTMPAPPTCEWGSGLVARAAVFTEAAVRAMPIGSDIGLILPDVLRSGTRYDKWRATMSGLMTVDSVEVVGRFDQWTDVDVIIMRGKRRAENQNMRRRLRRNQNAQTVADLFEVNVGAVVPHRDPKTGPSRLFLHAKGLPRFTTVAQIEERRQFAGTVVKPPFVAIRRTSRPGDGEARAIATLIDVSDVVAVENHLIVARPLDGRVSTCEELLQLLQLSKTTKTLNRQTRCRHLSIRFIKALRWMEATAK